MHLQSATVDTPLGAMILLGTPKTLIALEWSDGIERAERHLHRHIGQWTTEPVSEIPHWSAALHDYMSGALHAFTGLPLDPPGTAFQREVWAALQTIPCGETWSYKALAEAIGRPTSFRAVANANGKNPIPIVIPCHRVIASDGGLGGFSCGLHRKEWLLRHEDPVL
jgi:O-6-methylguanine DNA methyltransferase